MFRRLWKEMTWGELFDKLVIIKVKTERLPQNDSRLPKLREQFDYLTDHIWRYCQKNKIDAKIWELRNKLYLNAYAQWDFENLMSLTDDSVPVEQRLEAMKGSYTHNRERAKLKKEIDQLFGEKWFEVKQYSAMEKK